MIDKQQGREYQPPEVDEPLIPDLCRGDGLFTIIIIAELMALLVTLASSSVRDFDWMLFSAASIIALWITLVSALVLCLGKERMNRLGSRKAAVISFAVIMVVSLVCGAAAELARMLLNPSGQHYFSFWHIIDYVLITAIPAGMLWRYIYLQQQLRVRQRSELDARIEALQARIRPHFLFNSMNVIASLIHADPEKAEQAVEDISDLFRSTLSGSEVLVPLRDELSLCRRYLALEKLRLADRLATRWEIGDYGEYVKVPPLSLQPLIENAIYHGIQLLPEGGEISISVKGEENGVEITITNPLGRLEQQRKGNRMAIQNIRYRLKAHFREKASIEAKPEGETFVTRLYVPASS